MKVADTKSVVVVGGGFGGVKAALELSRNEEFSVTLISDKTDFRYNPTLYHTATGGLFRQSSIPLNDILHGGSITFIHAAAQKLDRATQSIELDNGEVVSYDTIVLALGVVTNYFHIDGLEKYSFGIKSIEEVAEFKAHLHKLLVEKKKPDLNYIIVGGGPSGVELAGVLPGYVRQVMKKHGLKDHRVSVRLIEAAPRLLPRSHESISSAVKKRLYHLGVKVATSQIVRGLDEDSLLVGEKDIPSHTVVWTAGTANNPFFKENNFTLSERGKVVVDEYLKAEDNIYVIGDNADTPFSGLAQIAVHDGQFVAHAIEAAYHGQRGSSYQPHTPATVVPVGEGWAAFEWGRLRCTGRLGWFIRNAADWIGYHDIEPWWKATEQWMTEFGEEENCRHCQKKATT